MAYILAGGIFFLDVVFSLLAYSIYEFSRFKLGEFVDEMKKENKDKNALYNKKRDAILEFFKRKENKFSAFMLCAYTLDLAFVLLLFTSIRGMASRGYAIGLVCLLYMLFIYIFCRMLVRKIAEYHAESIIFNSFAFIRIMSFLIFPVEVIAGALEYVGDAVARVGTKKESLEDGVEDEIKESITEGVEDGVLQEDEKKMIESVLEFDDSDVREIMTPRTDMVAIDATCPIKDALNVAIESGYSRIPVFEDTIDNVIGILYVKDLLKFIGKELREKGFAVENKLSEILRESYFIPESKMVSELFKEIREKKNHFAVVLDEYGGTAGIVTAEDIIEEIVGEIEDEYDVISEEKIVWLPENKVEVDAKIDIGELNEALNISLPDDRDFESLGGFLAAEMGKIPQTNERMQYDNVNFKVVKGTKRKILRVEITKEVAGKEDE